MALNEAVEGAGLGDWQATIGALIAFAASVFCASLLYHGFESHFLRLKRRFTAVRSRD